MTMPPRSRRRSWRAISRAAARLTSRAVCSWSSSALVRLPELVGAPFQRHVLGEERLDLLRDVEIVENGHLAPIEFDDLLLLGGDDADIVADLVEHRLVVDRNLRERRVERVADDGIGAVLLAQEQRRSRRFLDVLQGRVPLVDQRTDVVFHVGVRSVHRRRADNDAEILGQHPLRDAFEPLLLVGGADLLRNEDLRRKRHQHDVAAGQRDVGRQARAFGRNGLFGHLHHDRLPHFEVGADLAALFERRFQLDSFETDAALAGLLRRHELFERRKLRPQIEVMDESVLFVSDVDERGIQTGHDLANLAQIDISHREARLTLFLVELDEHLVFGQRNGDFSRGYVDD